MKHIWELSELMMIIQDKNLYPICGYLKKNFFKEFFLIYIYFYR
jgi:hypothetical protein